MINYTGDIANVFNDYFVDIGKNIAESIPNWKLRPRNCLQKEDDGRARILLSAREMIIRRWKDRFITEIVQMLRPKRVGGRQ